MAAGVHAPVVQGGEVDARLFPDGQRVDVGAEHDGAPGTAAFERGDGACLGGAVVNRETERGQARLDQLGGLELFEADLRVAVEVAARVNNLIEYSVCGCRQLGHALHFDLERRTRAACRALRRASL